MSQVANTYSVNIFSEENIRKEVLPYYDLKDAHISNIKFKDTDKQRAVYKVDKEGHSFCLKKVYFNENELLFVYSSIEWLFRNGIHVPRILPNNSKGRFVNYNDMLFILTPWIEGDKCDYDNKIHLKNVCETLAILHNRSSNFVPIKNSSNRIGYKDLYVETNKHFDNILVTSNLALKYKDRFSKIYLENFDYALNLATRSCKILATLNLDNLNISLCHNDYVNKNIIIDKKAEVWLIDFDKCRMDFSMHDFAYFLRRLMKREETNWDFNIAIECFNYYNNYRKIDLDDFKFLYGYLIFPQRYWKISRDYYKNIYKCNKNAFISILEKSVRHFQQQIEFSILFKNYLEDTFKTKLDI
jgi:CotS family spore coat protein